MVLALAVILAGAVAAGPAFASKGGSGKGGRSGVHHGRSHAGGHHGHIRSSAAFGAVVAPAFWPWWNYSPYYYPPVAMASAPPVEYIERSEQEGRMDEQQYWLYCAKAQAYFPYVAECPEGWERVPATPPKRDEG